MIESCIQDNLNVLLQETDLCLVKKCASVHMEDLAELSFFSLHEIA